MIHEIYARNFFSIKDEVKINLRAKTGSITYPELYLDAPFGKKTTKIAFFGGANASGKSNVLRILIFVKTILTKRIETVPLPYFPFFVKSGMRNDSEIKVVFSTEKDTEYTYDVIFQYDRIYYESLEVTSLVKKRATTHLVFERKWNPKSKKYSARFSDSLINIKRIADVDILLDEGTNKSNSIISLFSYLDSKTGSIRKVAEYWDNVYTNIPAIGNVELNNVTAQAENILKKVKERPEENSGMLEFLKRIDIGFEKIQEFPGKNETDKTYGLSHSYGENTILDLPVLLESTGTNRIICVMDTALKALSCKTGGVAVIDEADAFIHPDIYNMILEYFMSLSSNKYNAQLIVSSHNYTTLNSLDKQQIFLSERVNNGGTKVWRLDEEVGIDPRDNFYAKYMAGAYGAVPRSS